MEKTKLKQLSDLQVHKDNNLILRARYQLTANQQKILLYLISQIRSTDTISKEYSIDIKSYCNLVGIEDKGGAYQRIKDDILAISKAQAWVPTSDGETIIQWFAEGGVKIAKGSGVVTVRFSKTVEEYLFLLYNRFNTYKLDEILPMKSTYGIRMYEWLSLFNYKIEEYGRRTGNEDPEDIIGKPVTTTPDEIIYRFNLGQKYDKYRDLKRKVLLPAIEDINECSEEFHVKMEERKQGQKVVCLVFRLTRPTREELNGIMENKRQRLKMPLNGETEKKKTARKKKSAIGENEAEPFAEKDDGQA